MIQVSDVSKSFHGFQALDQVQMHVPKGSIYGLVGPNGAGKTTLIRHLTGIYKPDSGSIRIDGEPIWENPNMKARISYIPDDPFCFLQADTLEMKRFYSGIYPNFDKEMFTRMQEFFPSIDLKRNVRRLSRGITTIMT